MGVAVDKSGRQGLADGSVGRTTSPASKGKAPRTARGEKTLRKILDAALLEFGQRGFHDSSIVGITSRAKVALGTFYTYFDSKEAVFAALVRDMSRQVRDHVAPDIEGAADEIDRERLALASYLRFVFDHKEVYRIIDEAEFVDPAGFRTHYETAAARIAARLEEATAKGQMRDDGAARHGGPRLGDHGNERVPRPALRRVGPAGCGSGRGPRQRTDRTRTEALAQLARQRSESARRLPRHDRVRSRCAAHRRERR